MNKGWPYSRPRDYYKRHKKRKPFVLIQSQTNLEKEVQSTMDKFWQLLAQSTIFQGVITLLLLSTTCYLWISGKPVPDELWTANTFVLAFFFGAKAQQTIHRRVK